MRPARLNHLRFRAPTGGTVSARFRAMRSASGTTTATTKEDSRFERGRLLGRGGSCFVYEAHDRLTNRRVALKVLPEAASGVSIARLAREARAAMAINHPNVCATYERGFLDDGRAFLAMELLEGVTLRDHLSQQGRLSHEESIELAVQVLAGLEAAHATGLVHRDIKPENIFLVHDGHRLIVKLVDFGVCRSGVDDLDQQTLTSTGYVVGTPGYLAPEQVYGERTIDPRADLYAVGLVLFEALTGRAAFLGDDPALLAEALMQPVPAVRTLVAVPQTLDRIVAHATEREPKSRYPDAATFQHELLEARTAMRRAGSHSTSSREIAVAASDAWELPTVRLDPNIARRIVRRRDVA